MSMATACGLVTVWLGVPPEHDKEFNDWHNLEHLLPAMRPHNAQEQADLSC